MNSESAAELPGISPEIAPTKKQTPLSESALLALLRKKFPAPEYAFLSHVRNGTGFTRTTRTADAVAMSLWPSRGLHLTGFELKSSRSDWLSELKNPAKADEIGAFCDAWCLVVGSPDIVQPGELPPLWGLIVPDKKGNLRTTVEATVKKKELQKPVTRSFLAAILRNAQEASASQAEIKSAINEARDKWQADEAVIRHRDRGHNERDLEALRSQVAEFEKASGIHMAQWESGDRIGKAVRQILNHGHARFDHVLNTAHALVRELEQKAEVFKEYERAMEVPK